MSFVGALEGFLFLPFWSNSVDALRPFFAADGMAAVAAPVGVIDSLGEPAGRGVGDLLLRLGTYAGRKPLPPSQHVEKNSWSLLML